MGLNDLVQRSEAWKEAMLRENPGYFEQLAAGQQPHTLVIGCSDSRVAPSTIFGSQPGEIFVHRNVANQVLAHDDNARSVIDYALQVLKVNHLVVLGHYGCGGVKAAAGTGELSGPLSTWLMPLRELAREHHTDAGDADQLNELVRQNTLAQLDQIRQLPCYRQRLANGPSLSLHAWVFDITSGRVERLYDDTAITESVGNEAGLST